MTLLNQDLKGKNILLTDAEHFVGPVSSLALAELGATIYCQDAAFTDPDARTTYEARHANIVTLSAQATKDIAEEALAKADHIDVVVHNDAYPAKRAPIDEPDADEFRRTLDSLAVRPHELTGHLVPSMKARKAGKIIFMSSAAPIGGIPNFSMYAAARGCTNAMVRSLSLELARHNIQVNAIAPNYVDNPTYFPKELMENEASAKKILSNIPLGRLGTPQEASALVAFMASDLSGFITGQIIPLAGGWV